jgi:hypothetical protein
MFALTGPIQNRCRWGGPCAIAAGRALAVIALIVVGACRPDTVAGKSEGAVPADEAKPASRVIFPDDRGVEDPAVNRFMHEALEAAAEGDYERFRLLWTARQEPLERQEFEQGWQAVRTIRVRAIEKVLLRTNHSDSDSWEAKERQSDGDSGGEAISYVLLAEAEFDPDHPVGQRQPRRDFVLLVMREQGQWRLGRAPAQVRKWLRNRADGSSDSGLVAPADDR